MAQSLLNVNLSVYLGTFFCCIKVKVGLNEYCCSITSQYLN